VKPGNYQNYKPTATLPNADFVFPWGS